MSKTVNQDYFKTWSSNMSYVFGFWCAKGCIYDERVFDITVRIKDKYLVKAIAKELDYCGPILDSVNKQICRINFSCPVICNDLLSLTEKENCKSFLLDIPKEYFADFIRGYFDGAGTVALVKGNRINTAFTSNNKHFIFTLWRLLKEEAGVEKGSYDDVYGSLKFGKNDSLKIGSFMYKNNPELFLKRKRDKFKIFS